jgi:hypothetical protein
MAIACVQQSPCPWFLAARFQCHRLHNTSDQRGDFCATIQCYK